MRARRPRSCFVAYGGVEPLADLRLEARLLVEPDLEVRQHRQLHASPLVPHLGEAVVAGERLAQKPLTVRWLPRLQAVEKALQSRSVAGRALAEVAGELEPDLGEHLPVAARDRVRGELEGVERRVQLAGQAAQARLGVEQPAAEQSAPERPDRVPQPRPLPQLPAEPVAEILAADRPSRRTRRPRRVRAPVRARAASLRERRGEQRVAVRDLEVADGRARDRRNPPDVVDAGRRRLAIAHRCSPRQRLTLPHAETNLYDADPWPTS